MLQYKVNRIINPSSFNYRYVGIIVWGQVIENKDIENSSAHSGSIKITKIISLLKYVELYITTLHILCCKAN